MTNSKNMVRLLAAVSIGCALAACEKTPPPAAPAPVAAPAVTPPPAAAAPALVPAAPAAPVAPTISTDIDIPTPLPSKTISGVGVKKKLSYYYTFNAGAGAVKLTATSKNVSSAATQALGFSILDAASKRLCFDSSGNTTVDKTISLNCVVEKPQSLILRLDLSEETVDYTVALDGPVELPPPLPASAGAGPVAGAGSTDIDAPARLAGNRIKGNGINKPVAYYYAFNAGPGELMVTVDAKNKSAAVTDALQAGLYNLRSEKLCDISLGNTTLDKRGIVLCNFDKRQPVILRLDLSAETVDFRVMFDGPHDFEPFAPPKEVVIALDSAVLFDTGSSVLKADARKTLREAAARVKKFADAPVAISGHTDNVGSDVSNQVLSTSRAAAVHAYFLFEGIPQSRFSVKGYGKTQPVADNATEEGRARNRRVEVLITPK